MLITPCSVDRIEAAPNIDALLAEYGEEAGIAELGAPAAQFATYRLLESTGALQVIAAFMDGELAGFVTVLKSNLPHFGKQAGIVESLFATRKWRHAGVGAALLRAAEDLARSQGSTALLVSAPAEGRLEKILPHSGYRATNTIFFRSLA